LHLLLPVILLSDVQSVSCSR